MLNDWEGVRKGSQREQSLNLLESLLNPQSPLILNSNDLLLFLSIVFL